MIMIARRLTRRLPGLAGLLLRSAAGGVAGVALTAAVSEAQETPHGELRHLHGIVEDSISGRPLRDAEVRVDWTVGAMARSRETHTDGNGRFDFRDLPAAAVRVRVRVLGYAPSTQVIDLARADRLLTVHLVTATTVLQEVAVRADTLAERLGRVMATNTLDAAALASTRGQTLGETIKNLPGVSVIQFGPSIAKPVIRGLNSQRVLVMNAGLRQEDQQWGTEHAPNIDSFDADAVTVVRGAATVLYGPDALGGVVRVDRAAVPDTGGAHGDIALNTFSNSRQGALSLGVQGDADAAGAFATASWQWRDIIGGMASMFPGAFSAQPLPIVRVSFGGFALPKRALVGTASYTALEGSASGASQIVELRTSVTANAGAGQPASLTLAVSRTR